MRVNIAPHEASSVTRTHANQVMPSAVKCVSQVKVWENKTKQLQLLFTEIVVQKESATKDNLFRKACVARGRGSAMSADASFSLSATRGQGVLTGRYGVRVAGELRLLANTGPRGNAVAGPRGVRRIFKSEHFRLREYIVY